MLLDGGILAHIFVIVSAAAATAASAAHSIIFPGSSAGVVIHESRFCSSFTLLHTRAVVAEFPSELLSIPSLVVLKPLEQILSLYPAVERKHFQDTQPILHCLGVGRRTKMRVSYNIFDQYSTPLQ
ncbi:unnamed protein product [Sphenostylis stenocarpa]|uniref:Secreted protein n=1 Tax=Sphenostylis stenocarpa TaxID=92480 RepID=A0AA86VYP4_9FABA|nr:unnamed protein product [Sphenostylis stenocarpa]